SRQLARSGALEQRLDRTERGRGVTTTPRVAQREHGRLRGKGREQTNVVALNRIATGPGRQLLDLAPQPLRLLADRLDERQTSIPLGARPELLELLRYPPR